MDYEFWDGCWSRDSQPFHVAGAHQLLLRHYAQQFKINEKILIPLSGKSVDPLFLRSEGYKSVCIEFNSSAVEQFFIENKLNPQSIEYDSSILYRLDNIDIWVADFFALTVKQLGTFSQVFDRAALVALPEELRDRYAKHLQTLLKPKGSILMVTMDYNTEQMSGPPFYVSFADLQNYFPGAKISEIDRQSLMDNHPRWKELELDYLDEVLYLISF